MKHEKTYISKSFISITKRSKSFFHNLLPYKGYTEGEVVGDYGSEIVVRLNNDKEVVEYRDEVLIYD